MQFSGAVGDKGCIWTQISHADVAAIAQGQQSNVTRQQLLDLGMGPGAIKHRVRSGLLYPSYPGVYSVGKPATTPLERAAAAVLAGGPHAILSHASAMTLWGFWKRWDEPFEVTLIRGDRRPKGISTHRSKTLRPRDVTTQLDIPVTSPARTLYDMAPRLTAKARTRAVNDALHTPYLHQSHLEELLDRHPNGHLMERFVTTRSGPSRSDWEDAFPAFCDRHDLPEPLMNVLFLGYIRDAYFPDYRLIVELDSWEYHKDRAAFESDRDRDADTLAADHATVRITWERMHATPAKEAARLHAIISHRRAA